MFAAPLAEARAEPAGLAGVAVLETSEDLQQAIGSADVSLAWQGWFDLGTGRVCGHEALLRWHRPGIGAVHPVTFIPMAETTGLMPALDDWVLDAACRAAAAWPALPGGGAHEVGVNVAPSSFCAVDLVDQVEATLARTGLPPERLVLEVTERLAMDRPTLVRERVGELHGLGVQVALDDFGIGCSALSDLRAFAFDRVKLDCALIRDVGDGPAPAGGPTWRPRAEAIARSVIAVGRSMGVPVCAEGVETDGQLAFLRANGCTMAQGFLLGRPAAAPVG